MAELDTPALQKLLSANLPLHAIIENEVRLTPFGQITFTLMVKDGVAQIETLNIIKSRRRRYGLDKEKDL